MPWVYKRLKKTKALEPGFWPESKRQEALMTYLTVGNLVTVSAIVKVPYETVRYWKKQPWWKEQVEAFYDDDKQELDAKYQKIVRKALTVVEDRLDNGNFQMDQKTGKITRVPVNLADTHRVMKDLVDQQQKLRKDKVVEAIAQETINDKLVKLASQFAEMALQGKKGKTYDNELTPLEAPGEVIESQVIPNPT